jgi:hypothetical protein
MRDKQSRFQKVLSWLLTWDFSVLVTFLAKIGIPRSQRYVLREKVTHRYKHDRVGRRTFRGKAIWF